jgi:hypothetical protein
VVNIDARCGKPHAAVAAEKGQVVARSATVPMESARQPVTWAEKDITSLIGQRIVLRGARLYSSWFGP